MTVNIYRFIEGEIYEMKLKIQILDIGKMLLKISCVLLAICALDTVWIQMIGHVNIYILSLVFIFINILFFLYLIKKTYKYLEKGKFPKYIHLSFGLLSYLCLIFQFSVAFFMYYVAYEIYTSSYNMIPEHIIYIIYDDLSDTDFIDNARIIVRAIVSYVVPNFYKYSTATGIMPTIQFYLGKFTDIFILAFIVDKIKTK